VAAVHSRRFVHLGIGALVIAASGFLVSGLSRLVVARDTALLLGAPLLVLGFLLAVVAFVLALLVTLGVVDLENDASGSENDGA
jgi:membrane protein implicated in regulation of membrane protease activity